MKELASSSYQCADDDQATSAVGAQAAAGGSTPGTAASAGSGQAAGQAVPVAPIVARAVFPNDPDTYYELVDAAGLVVSKGWAGKNSAAAIARILNDYIRRGGFCLVHLTERSESGRCLACQEGWVASPFAAVGR